MSGVDLKRLILYRFSFKVVVKCSIDDVHRKSAPHWLDKETVSEACKKFKLKIVKNVTVQKMWTDYFDRLEWAKASGRRYSGVIF